MSDKDLPKVVLIPARFTTPIQPIDLLSSPSIQNLVGISLRKSVLNDYVSNSSNASIGVNLSPEANSVVRGRVSVPITAKAVGIPVGGLDISFRSNALPFGFSGSSRLGIDSAGGLVGSGYMRRLLNGGAVDTYMRSVLGTMTLGTRFAGQEGLIGFEHTFLPNNLQAPPVSSVYVATSISTETKAQGILLGGQVIVDETLKFPYEMHATLNSGFGNMMSLSFASPGRDESPSVTLGYLQRIFSKRRVYNPLENKRVSHIVNYIDTAIEATFHPIRSSSSSIIITGSPSRKQRELLSTNNVGGYTEFSLGSSWQPNKNWLFKTRVSSLSGISGTVACKSFWKPMITCGITAGFKWSGFYTGVVLDISNTNDSLVFDYPPNASPAETSQLDRGVRWIEADTTETTDRVSPATRLISTESGQPQQPINKLFI